MFAAIAAHLSSTAAGANLRVPQPPLSRQVGDREVAIGVNLFERSTRRVRLTAAGDDCPSEIVGASPCPGQRGANMEPIDESGARTGFQRVWRALTRRRLPVTVSGVASAI